MYRNTMLDAAKFTPPGDQVEVTSAGSANRGLEFVMSVRLFGGGLIKAGLCCEDRLETYYCNLRQGGTLESSPPARASR